MSNLTQSSEPGCNNAPGDIIELRRLPGVRLEVVAVWKRESFGDREIYMLELVDDFGDRVYMRTDDEHETLLDLTPCSVSDEPQSSAILGDEE